MARFSYTARMKHDYDAQHLNIEVFANANGSIAGTESLARFGRLLEEAQGVGSQNPVHFTAKGMTRPNGATSEQIWLALTAEVALPLLVPENSQTDLETRQKGLCAMTLTTG